MLEDETSPFTSCEYISRSSGRKCPNPALRSRKSSNLPSFCDEHLRDLIAKEQQQKIRRRLKKRRKAGKLEKGNDGDAKRQKLIEQIVTTATPGQNRSKSPDSSDSDSEIVHRPITDDWKLENSEDLANNADWDDFDPVNNEVYEPLRYADVLTPEEVVATAQSKLIRLQSLYIEQFKRLFHLLKERKRQYIHDLRKEIKEEKVSGTESLVDPNDIEGMDEDEIYALATYRRRTGVEALLRKKQQKRRIENNIAMTDFSLKSSPQSRCSHASNHTRCKSSCLPYTKYCSAHILEDPHQLLYKKCHTDQCPIPVCYLASRSYEIEPTSDQSKPEQVCYCSVHAPLPEMNFNFIAESESEKDLEQEMEVDVSTPPKVADHQEPMNIDETVSGMSTSPLSNVDKTNINIERDLHEIAVRSDKGAKGGKTKNQAFPVEEQCVEDQAMKIEMNVETTSTSGLSTAQNIEDCKNELLKQNLSQENPNGSGETKYTNMKVSTSNMSEAPSKDLNNIEYKGTEYTNTERHMGKVLDLTRPVIESLPVDIKLPIPNKHNIESTLKSGQVTSEKGCFSSSPKRENVSKSQAKQDANDPSSENEQSNSIVQTEGVNNDGKLSPIETCPIEPDAQAKLLPGLTEPEKLPSEQVGEVGSLPVVESHQTSISTVEPDDKISSDLVPNSTKQMLDNTTHDDVVSNISQESKPESDITEHKTAVALPMKTKIDLMNESDKVETMDELPSLPVDKEASAVCVEHDIQGIKPHQLEKSSKDSEEQASTLADCRLKIVESNKSIDSKAAKTNKAIVEKDETVDVVKAISTVETTNTSNNCNIEKTQIMPKEKSSWAGNDAPARSHIVPPILSTFIGHRGERKPSSADEEVAVVSLLSLCTGRPSDDNTQSSSTDQE